MRSLEPVVIETGDAVGIVAGPYAALFAGVIDATALDCFATLNGAGLEEMVDVLLGNGIWQAPDFVACAWVAGELRMLHHGAGVARVWTEAGPLVIAPTRGVGEQIIPDPVGVELALGEFGAESVLENAAAPRLGAGIVTAVRIGLGRVVHPAAATPAPVLDKLPLVVEAPVVVETPEEDLDAATVPSADLPLPDPGPAEVAPTTDPATMLRTFATPEPAPSFVLAPPDPLGDMEMTIARDDLAGALADDRQLVWAKVCPNAHVTPAFAPTCRVCHEVLPPQDPRELPRPSLGVLVVGGTGEQISLDRDVILGRSPRQPEAGTDTLSLLKVTDPDCEVSGQHARVSVNFWDASVADLGSTNGTEIVRPGGQRDAVSADSPAVFNPGDQLVLGGVVVVRYEAT